MTARSGFSLTELLIVVIILSILASIGISTYTRQFSRGRDQTRIADLKKMQNALEQFRANTGSYPGENGYCESSAGRCSTKCPCATLTGDWDGAQIKLDLVPNYLDEMPLDPINDKDFYYYYEPVADSKNSSSGCGRKITCSDSAAFCEYFLNARLEDGTVYEVCGK